MRESERWKWSRSVVSDSYRPHGLQPTRLLRPWDFPGKSTGVGCLSLLQRWHTGSMQIMGLDKTESWDFEEPLTWRCRLAWCLWQRPRLKGVSYSATEPSQSWQVLLSQSESESEVTQPCPTLCDPMDCSLTSSSVHGILQAKDLDLFLCNSISKSDI